MVAAAVGIQDTLMPPPTGLAFTARPIARRFTTPMDTATTGVRMDTNGATAGDSRSNHGLLRAGGCQPADVNLLHHDFLLRGFRGVNAPDGIFGSRGL
jgi:hypothetical protein